MLSADVSGQWSFLLLRCAPGLRLILWIVYIAEFIPYAFQICSQLLELHPANSLPAAYENLLTPLLHAALWESRGNVPALVRLWKALILRGADVITKNNQVQGLLGIFQRLIASKNTDVYAFELIGVMYEAVSL